MFKLRNLGLLPFLSSTLFCVTALHANLASAGWTNTSSTAPTMLAAGNGTSVYAADLAAIYASNDGGTTWAPSGNPGNNPFTALTFANNALWLGTDKNGTYTSADGKTWSISATGQSSSITLGSTSFSFPPQSIKAITAANSTTLLAGNASGLYRSTDNGKNWDLNATGLPQSGIGILATKQPITALTATTSGIALAGSPDGIYRSTDAGATWSNAALSGVTVSALLAIPGSTTVYAIAGGLYKSADDGKTWTAVSTWKFGTPTALAAHPSDSLTIYVGDNQGAVHSSKDGSSSWLSVGDNNVTTTSILALAVPPANANTLVAATASGLFLYTTEVITQPPFSIPASFGANPGDIIESDEFSATGLTGPTAISIQGGSYSINGGAYTSQAGSITPGARIKVKVQASSNYSATTSATLTIGKRSAAFSVTTLKKTVVTNITDVLQTNTGVTLSNGELSLSNGASLTFKSTTPNDVVLKPASGATFTTTNSGGGTITYSTATQTTGTTFVTRTVTDSSGNSVTGIAIANGQSNISSTTPLTIPFVTNSTSTPSLSLASGGTLQVSANSQQSSAGILNGQATVNYNGIASSSDKINTFAAGSVTVYGGETVSLSSAGALKQVRIGSLNGDQKLAGDPLALNNLDTGVNVPKLDGNLQRLGNTSSLLDLIKGELDKQFAGTGTISYDAALGIVTYQISGKTYRFIPVGNPTVQLPAAAAINGFSAASAAAAASGTFNLISRGVQLTMSSTLAYFNDLDKALKAFSPSASFKLKSTGALKITLPGLTLFAIPSSATTSSSSGNQGFGFNDNSQLTFQDSSGGTQILYPVFADLSVVDQLFKSFDAKATTSYSGDGTTALFAANTNFALKPNYTIDALPSSHSNDLWWLDSGKIYIRYSDNTAQWFSF